MFKLIENLELKYEGLCTTPSDINEHLPTLRKYASECEHITEMGVRWVVSTWALLAAKPKVLRSYDLFDPVFYGGDISQVEKLAKANCVDFKFTQANVLYLEKIDETDLLFIDTQHTYKQLDIELRKFEQFVKTYIVLHDTTTFGYVDEVMTDASKIGLQAAIEEFTANNSNWVVHDVYTNNNGLTVLRRVV
jgi:hypothetical protein